MRQRKVFVILIILIILLGSTLFFKDEILIFLFKLKETKKEPSVELVVEDIEKEIFTPPPLQAKKEYLESFLTRRGVIRETNSEREKNGLPSLAENSKLNLAAELKIEDMLKLQYFAHISPLGVDMGDVAKNVNYSFIIIGENLAEGNFKDDKDLVQAWMASPGHKANILNNRYQEIGIAVRKGIFKGKSTWFAVQVFALPASVCPQPDEALLAEIRVNEKELQEKKKVLEEMQTEIKNIEPKSGSYYNQKIEEYNTSINQYNNLVAQTQAMVREYNKQVKAVNQCIKGI